MWFSTLARCSRVTPASAMRVAAVRRRSCARHSNGKREVRIYDYADLNVPMLARMFDRRCRGYEAIG
jgi:hypothetical protein